MRLANVDGGVDLVDVGVGLGGHCTAGNTKRRVVYGSAIRANYVVAELSGGVRCIGELLDFQRTTVGQVERGHSHDVLQLRTGRVARNSGRLASNLDGAAGRRSAASAGCAGKDSECGEVDCSFTDETGGEGVDLGSVLGDRHPDAPDALVELTPTNLCRFEVEKDDVVAVVTCGGRDTVAVIEVQDGVEAAAGVLAQFERGVDDVIDLAVDIDFLCSE